MLKLPNLPVISSKYFYICVRVESRKSLLNVIIVLALNIYTLLTGGWITLLFQHIRFRDIELLLVCLHSCNSRPTICSGLATVSYSSYLVSDQ